MVYKHLLVYCALSCLIWNRQVQAQDFLSLTRLWDLSIQQYPSVEAHKAAMRQADINHRLTKNQYLPQIQLQAQHTLGTYQGMAGAFSAIELDRTHAQLMRDSAAYLALQAEMVAAEQLNNYTYITAPFGGVITSRKVSQGALVGENDQPLFSLSQQDRLRLTIAIPEKHAHAVQDSTEVVFTVSGRPGETFKAPMSRSSKTLDPSLRSLMVEFDVNNQDNLLSGGEYAQVTLRLSRPNATIQVPASSVVQVVSRVFVVKVANESIQRVPVETGIRQGSLIEVFGNLQEGDLIAVKGSEELREGMKVTAAQQNSAPERSQRTAMSN